MTTKNKSIEIKSVSEFLEAVKQIYCDKDHQLFYRGVSKVEYATPEHDHPGIYRNKNWIDNEDKMFYELTAKCPEYFKDCKTTFEHLVMMQHYGYPTRLLDITSNPLVALYFACGGLNGSNSEDGQLVSYHIEKDDIRNYKSDRVSLLSNLVLSSFELESFSFLYISWRKFFQVIEKKLYSLEHYTVEKKNNCGSVILGLSAGEDQEILKSFVDDHKRLCDEVLMLERSNDTGLRRAFIDSIEELLSYYGRALNNREIQKLYSCLISFKYLVTDFEENPFYADKFCKQLTMDNYTFDISLINPVDMRTIQCVLPKHNNPRLIAQQGVFLLFGFKDSVSNKTAIPIIPYEMYGKFEACIKGGSEEVIERKPSEQKAEIIIKGDAKQDILNELKILGISNSTMFPEIDNIANELKSQYAKPR